MRNNNDPKGESRLRRHGCGKAAKGLGKNEEIVFFATLTYMRKWCLAVQYGIPEICELYEKAQEHAAETHAFERIRGSVKKALHNMKKNIRTKDARCPYSTAVAKNNHDAEE